MTDFNSPLWNPKGKGGFQEVWYLKFNDPKANRAIWLRFTLLESKNRFKRIAEVWGIYFDPQKKHRAFKQTFPIEAFRWAGDEIHIDSSTLSSQETRGSIQSKGKELLWNLKIKTASHSVPFNMVPTGLSRLGLVKNTAITVQENLLFTGTTTVDGQEIQWNDAPGMQGHLAGPKNGHSWCWGHCNTFRDQSGQPVDLIFDGLSAKARLKGPLTTPQMSTFYFHYKGKNYFIHSVLQAIRSKSSHTLQTWYFRASDKDFTFEGDVTAEINDFVGVTYEDTDGSFLFCANTKVAKMTLTIFEKGKRIGIYQSQSAAFEVVTRKKNPYTQMLI